ncbi:MAG: RNA polymerase sigma factor [Patescibacteria group bacterium]
MKDTDTEQAFRKAFELHADELFRHASMRLSDRDRALELTQECFLRAWQYASRGEEIREMRAFLYRTLRNLIVDEYRKAKSYSLDSMIEDDEGGQIESLMPRDDTNTLEAAVVRFEGAHAIAAIRKLPDLYREILTMRYVNDLSIREIASLIGESENVVSVRLHRGLKKLHAFLEAEQHEKI